MPARTAVARGLAVTVLAFHHAGVVVHDLDAAVAFFAAVGLEEQGRATVGDAWAGRAIGVPGTIAEIVFLAVPGGGTALEVSRFVEPADGGDAEAAPANRPGLRHLAFEVDDLDAVLDRVRGLGHDLVGEPQEVADVYRLAYVRGPAGAIVELAQPLVG